MIPFNGSTRAPEEIELVRAALLAGDDQSEAHYADQCTRILGNLLDCSYATLTPSCTAALELAALVLRIGPGDEVIVPSFTFSSTANAFLLRGARIVFADIQKDTLCLDPEDVERKLGPRTRAIVAMHYAGIACDMDRLTALSRASNASLIEDAAHALFGKLDGRALGAIGDMGAFSFHRTKNLSCDEGGAFVTNNPEYAEAAEVIREKGTNRSQFMQGLVHKYEWVREGSSFIMAELLAAKLLAQLRWAEQVQARRRDIWLRYQRALANWAADEGVQQPHVPEGCEPAWHLYHLVMPSAEDRTRMLEHLRARDVGAAFHYLPLHLTPSGRGLGGSAGDAPVSEWAAARLVRLPFFTSLSSDDQDRVIDAVLSFRTSASSARARRAAGGASAPS
jgi:dTDP-4-amino-4,6-dideoxygalactose transaminase